MNTNMRVERLGRLTQDGQAIAAFSRWLLDIGEGVHERVVVPEHMWVDFEDPLTLIAKVFPDLGVGESAGTNACILTTHNKYVDELNDDILERDRGEAVEYLSADYFGPEAAEVEEHYPVEVLNTLTAPGLPPHRLCLKVGCPVVFLRNMNLKDGIMNGTRGIVMAYQGPIPKR